MSYKDARWIDMGDKPVFGGGYVDNATNVNIGTHYSPYLRNCRLDGHSIIIRPGHQLHATLATGDYPRGIGSYLRTTASNDRLVVRHNISGTEKLYTIDEAGTATAITTGGNISSDNRMTFSNIGDVVYCMNGVDDFGKLSGTTYTTPSTGISNFSPSFAESFNGSHRAAGWTDNPNKLYKSVADDYEDFNSSGSDQFTFPETITGLKATTQTLFIFTKNYLAAIDQSNIQDVGGTVAYFTTPVNVQEGAINNASIVAAGINVFYLTPSNKIMRVRRGFNIDGFEVEELSDRKYQGIDTIMDSLDADQTNSFAYYLPSSDIIKWFFRTQGAEFNDICVIYDVNKDAWLIDNNKFFYGGVSFKGKAYTISELEPKVYRDEYSQDDEGAGISFQYRTKEFYASDPTFKNVFWSTRTLVDINELAELQQDIYVDGELVDSKTVDIDNIMDDNVAGIGVNPIGAYGIGTGGYTNDDGLREVKIERTKGNLNVRGKKIQMRYTNTTLAGKARLKSLNIKAERLPEQANSLTT